MRYSHKLELQRLADAYNVATGKLTIKRIDKDVNEELSRRVAECYINATSQHNTSARVQSAYSALNNEVSRQFAFVTAFGYEMELVDTPETYSNVDSMALDVCELRRLKVWRGGTPEHGLIDAMQNAKFRFVHDIFGHVASFAQFGHIGEEKAYRSHYQMFSAWARLALATETRGQNCALHFRQVNAIATGDSALGSVFEPQKAFILPEALRAI